MIKTKLKFKDDGVSDLIFVKERRHAAKLLTIVFRDYARVLNGGNQ